MIIEKYINALISNDYKSVAACFAPKCTYYDACPITIGQQNYHLYGHNGIEMFFHNKFMFNNLSISDYVIEDERHANFFAKTRGFFIYVRIGIEKISEDGLIKHLMVRPA